MAFGAPVFSYPFGWTLQLALAVGLGFLLALAFGLWRRRLSPRGLVLAALVLVVGAGMAALVAHLAWQLIVATHPEAQYFAVGKVDQDQVESYSKRKGQDIAVSERWLMPNLGYDG